MKKGYLAAIAGATMILGAGAIAGSQDLIAAEEGIDYDAIGTIAAVDQETVVTGYDEEAIRVHLAASGFELLSLEAEDGELEGMALREGNLWEIELDPTTGRLIEAELQEDEYELQDDD